MKDTTATQTIVQDASSAGSTRHKSFSIIFLLLLGLLMEAAYLEIVRIGDLRTGLVAVSIGGQPVTILVFWLPFFAAFLPYLIAVARGWRHMGKWNNHPIAKRSQCPQWGPAITQSQSDRSVPNGDLPSPNRKAIAVSPMGTCHHPITKWLPLAIILLFAVAFRITMLFSPPTLSDDIFRYVWDGKMQNHGVNPYVYPPNGGEVAPLRDIYYPGINNKHISTIYPPLLQIVFRVVDLIAHTPMAMKVCFILCDLGIIGLILILLRNHGYPLGRVLIYAWNPLVIVEVAGSGHNDPLALGLMLAALWAITADKPKLSILYLALSFVAKFFSVVLIPSFFLGIRRIRPFLIFPAVIVLFYLSYLDAGDRLFHGLLVYSDKWRFNDSLFTLALTATGSLIHAKVVVGSIFMVIVLGRMLSDRAHLQTAYVLVGAYLLLTPTFQPWYLIWIVPFLCFFPNRAWILLTGLAMVAYNVLIQFTQTGIWREETWVRYVQFIPFYTLMIFDAIRYRMQAHRVEPLFAPATTANNVRDD